MSAMKRLPDALDVEGPVQAEIFVLWLHDDHIEVTGPCGAAPWLVEIGVTEHPVEVVDRLVRDGIGDPMLVHSTSWRREHGGVILSFVVVIAPTLVADMESAPVERAELARSDATAAPSAIAHAQVLEHGLRHLAWLVREDPVVAAELRTPWPEILADYVPEPFRALASS
jgi:hypothetical protein